MADSGFSISSIRDVLQVIQAAFTVPEPPLSPLPPALIMSGSKMRSGLSAQGITARIISRQSEAGRQVGDVFADGPNNEEAMELIRIEEIINALHTEAKIDVVIQPGTRVMTTGITGYPGTPIVSQGATIDMGIGDGIIR